ncbi:MAG: patatin-like phospholipase family protein [Elainellaceae cyanobacterium]
MAKKIGLVLGGGGARGWAHIGVIRTLEEAGVKIDYVAGTSIGALVGSVYAVGALDELEAFAAEATRDRLLPLIDISFPGLGLIKGERVYELISQYLEDKTFEQTHIPLRCVATNFLSNKEVVFESGRILDAVRASISIPGIFVPFKRGGVYLVDGGAVNPVPVDVGGEMGADLVIAVNLNHNPETEKTKFKAASTEEDTADSGEAEAATPNQQEEDAGLVDRLTDKYETLKSVLSENVDDWIPDSQSGLSIFDVVGNSMNAMEQRVTENNLQRHQPDLLIQPDLMEFGIFDFHRAEPIIERGYAAARDMKPQIEQLIAEASG